jgi:hypothetical protein
MYAGNNEDYQVQESFGLTYNYEDKNPDNWLKTDFPARYIYEKVSACSAQPPSLEPALTKDLISCYPKSSTQRARTCHIIQAALGEMG